MKSNITEQISEAKESAKIASLQRKTNLREREQSLKEEERKKKAEERKILNSSKMKKLRAIAKNQDLHEAIKYLWQTLKKKKLSLDIHKATGAPKNFIHPKNSRFYSRFKIEIIESVVDEQPRIEIYFGLVDTNWNYHRHKDDFIDKPIRLGYHWSQTELLDFWVPGIGSYENQDDLIQGIMRMAAALDSEN